MPVWICAHLWSSESTSVSQITFLCEINLYTHVHYSGPFIMCHSHHTGSFFQMTHGSIPHPKHLAESLIKRHFSKQNSISLLHTSETERKYVVRSVLYPVTFRDWETNWHVMYCCFWRLHTVDAL